jgi:hypothetical protein
VAFTGREISSFSRSEVVLAWGQSCSMPNTNHHGSSGAVDSPGGVSLGHDTHAYRASTPPNASSAIEGRVPVLLRDHVEGDGTASRARPCHCPMRLPGTRSGSASGRRAHFLTWPRRDGSRQAPGSAANRNRSGCRGSVASYTRNDLER